MVLTSAEIDTFFRRLAAERPSPRIELNYMNAFTLLIAVVLSAQTTDRMVNRVTQSLFQVADTPQRLLALGEEKLRAYIRTIGLFNNKARNLIRLSQILIDEYHGELPTDREALERLPGVGRKSANVVLNVALGYDTIAVDRHIFRLANRSGLGIGKTPLAVEERLNEVIPGHWKHDAHHWLVLHGRYVCKARRPLCYHCVVKDLCHYPNKTVG